MIGILASVFILPAGALRDLCPISVTTTAISDDKPCPPTVAGGASNLTENLTPASLFTVDDLLYLGLPQALSNRELLSPIIMGDLFTRRSLAGLTSDLVNNLIASRQSFWNEHGSGILDVAGRGQTKRICEF